MVEVMFRAMALRATSGFQTPIGWAVGVPLMKKPMRKKKKRASGKGKMNMAAIAVLFIPSPEEAGDQVDCACHIFEENPPNDTSRASDLVRYWTHARLSRGETTY